MQNSQFKRIQNFQFVFCILHLLGFVNLDDFPAKDFPVRDRDFLLACLARHGAAEELAGALAGGDDELEAVFLGCSFQLGVPLSQCFTLNVRMMASARSRIARTRARSATTMACNLATADSRSSLMTT